VIMNRAATIATRPVLLLAFESSKWWQVWWRSNLKDCKSFAVFDE
jgi:hypothetical protein